MTEIYRHGNRKKIKFGCIFLKIKDNLIMLVIIYLFLMKTYVTPVRFIVLEFVYCGENFMNI